MAIQQVSADALAHINPAETLHGRASVTDACFTLLGVLKVCWKLAGNKLTVEIDLVTPFGSVKIGSATLSPDKPTVTLGGGAFGFKAEVTLTLDFKELSLTVKATVCAPVVGCKSGGTTIHI